MTKQSKKEARLIRKLEKELSQKGKSARLSSSVVVEEKYVRLSVKPQLDKIPVVLSHDAYKDAYFSWCDTQADKQGNWSWRNNESRLWTDEEFSNPICSHLESYSNNSWREVEAFTYNGSGGYRKLLNKYQSLDSICDEAQLRWMELELISQFDELFRFRLGSDRRIWGIRLEHHFYIVWYERYHQICPVKN